jgi:citrate lyase beta subunit
MSVNGMMVDAPVIAWAKGLLAAEAEWIES